ncbi:hypothetical protein [Pantoea sp. Cy-640]|jgi:uncharacterized oxidoreductase|uniref:hypothetical protein n=1 Tax=Pantoea sp. Cy-640 TaxID=2608353 RepID=UPI001FFDA2B0|nr:hypothetical protein [Pantoea sp. Cy-640]
MPPYSESQSRCTDTIEAIVDRVLPVRDNPGANEHTLVNQFNQSVADNPIPVQ